MERGQRKIKIGTVLSNKMDKTAVVEVVRSNIHPLYKKVIKRNNKFFAHDPENICQIGDKVKIIECRPLSKNKRWRLVEVLEKADVETVQLKENA